MKNQTLNPQPVAAIPEVVAFEDVKARLQAFKDANPEFFAYLDTLIEEYNTKLEAAEKACRNLQVSCGDFVLYQYQKRWHPEELYTAVGHQKFLELGGKLTTETKYDLDKARVEAAIASGAIPPEVAERVCEKKPYFHKPDKVKIP